eukprot:TRINITY_DN3237_c0_g1_i1.p1 TRINITY_DN3237_c0_g1~~TRINITY_DN3237_c0_g1_i1.p1  ORF type:complete len:510 (+),score=115.12 TRINITY_DN3237_c0_g1_i1:74-1531(+)
MGCTNIDNERLYKLLEVEKTASKSEIRKAHQKLVRIHHPDRGGDPEKFREVQMAYEILSDPEKRSRYDRFGEEGLETAGAHSGMDFFDLMQRTERKKRTKTLVTPLKVTLEELYSGKTKKMAVNRKVIDKSGVKTCDRCNGRGVCLEAVQFGGHIQQIASDCSTCSGTGKHFKHNRQREVLEVHIPKGAPDEHKLIFREKADELPGADTGDVVFVLKEQEHPEFKRKGADLFLERKISLVEALCGFELEVTHLDGRKLLIRSSPGEVVRPTPIGFNPLHQSEEIQWECLEGFACPDIETVARADETDVHVLKTACATQLKSRGLDINAFVVDASGAHFKKCSVSEALASKQPCAGSSLYVAADPMVAKPQRMMKAVRGEGMPTLKNPFAHGNLFLIFTIEFPDSLPEDSLKGLRQLLPAPLHEASSEDLAEMDDSKLAEVHTLADMDPQESQAANAFNMQVTGEAYDEDNDTAVPGPQVPGCQQM